jgi:hypothetical protein
MGVGASTPAGPTIRVISYSWVNGAWGAYHFGEYPETDTINDVAIGSGADTIVVLTGNEELTAYVRGPDDQSPFVPLDDNLATGIVTLVSNLTGGAYPTLYLRFGSLDDCANGCAPGETAVDSYVNNGNGTYTINFEDGTSVIITNNSTTGLWEQTGPAININPALPTAVDTLVIGAQSTEGPGTKMFFADGSFRAGKADGTRWDAANRGLYSAGFGYNSFVTGDYGFAAGLACDATGNATTALGMSAKATHDNSLVWSDGAFVPSTAEKQATFAASGGFRVLGTVDTGININASPSAAFVAVTGPAADIELALVAKGASDVTVNKDPVTSMGVATKQYVDSAIAGLDWKESCQFATVADLGATFTGDVDYTNPLLFDLSGAVTVIAVGNRVLVKNEAVASRNGIYECTVAGATGTLVRAPDHDGSPASEVSQGNTTYVENGSTAGFMSYVLAGAGSGTDGQIVLNTDDINWYQFCPQSPQGPVLWKQTGNTFHFDQPNAPTVQSLLFSHTTTSTEGGSSRLFFQYGAFRAGSVSGTQWDGANRGLYSAAFGLNCTASSAQTFAAGNNSTASGARSIAMGNACTASGFDSVAIGKACTSSSFASTTLGTAANAAHDYSLVWSDGTNVSSTAEKQATFAASGGFRVLGAASATGTVQTATTSVATMEAIGGGADIELALVAKGNSDVTVNKDPVTSMGVATKQYVDSAIAGLDWKESCQFATVTELTGGTYTNNTFSNFDLTSSAIFDLSGPKTDVEVDDRVLVKNESVASSNGIYVCTIAGNPGTLVRAPDHDGSPAHEVSQGNTTYVENGNAAGFMSYVLAGDGTDPGGQIVLDTDDINWYRFSPQSPGKSSIREWTTFWTPWPPGTISLYVEYTRVFDQVFMNVPANYGNGTATGEVVFTVPEGYRPKLINQAVVVILDTNNRVTGRMIIGVDGVVHMGPISGQMYDGFGDHGWDGISISYLGAPL